MFVVLVNYLKPIEEVERVVVPHRTYLDELYAQGVLLASGPKIPRTGGVLLAKGMDKQELWEMLQKDPFCTQGIAEYTMIEFDPIKHNPILKNLI
ncbi:MAG: GTP cyclohydrolase [Alphaproteobacteria bacterium]|jgi:uncharacterized protein YciI|nr:GTP cyclohydrolase [Alphaproteobacteria bacterium]MCB1550941.1 GTP cyclohydrolase [Alphaproteobacteria bacterium]MCB9985750.1 GTP cyclohydrolase [Micavibrio sp.]HRK97618.1 YciI family protein [Alphaproteobacteria bacterium]